MRKMNFHKILEARILKFRYLGNSELKEVYEFQTSAGMFLQIHGMESGYLSLEKRRIIHDFLSRFPSGKIIICYGYTAAEKYGLENNLLIDYSGVVYINFSEIKKWTMNVFGKRFPINQKWQDATINPNLDFVLKVWIRG